MVFPWFSHDIHTFSTEATLQEPWVEDEDRQQGALVRQRFRHGGADHGIVLSAEKIRQREPLLIGGSRISPAKT